MSILRWSGRVLLAVVILVSLVALAAWLALRGSLPRLDGQVAAPGLAAPVTIARDARGMPAIEGQARDDLAYATGYAHAQDRFFQMDMLRRAGAGELSELLGPSMLAVDKERRLHRERARAEALLATLPAADRHLLERYAAGANDGLASLHVRPFEYLVLRSVPRRWEPVDSLLVIWSMYFELQMYQQARAVSLAWFHDHTTPSQFDYFFPPATSYDAPLDAAGIVSPAVALPGEAPAWLRRGPDTGATVTAADMPVPMVGSNNWAISGPRSTTGGAIVADDMHLTLGLPNAWYRLSLAYKTPGSASRRIVGVTLPGLPYIVAGSNGHVAWGLTNSYCECVRLVPLEMDPVDAGRLLTPQGWERVRTIHEHIAVHGGAPVTFDVRETSAGPIVEVDGKPWSVQWVASQAGAVNLRFADLEDVRDLGSALALASASGIPAQNFVAGDAGGHIGWTIAGALPRHTQGSSDLLPATDHPRVLDPADGQLWTANNRQLAGPGSSLIGDGGADVGARAGLIRDRLHALPPHATQQEVADIALDDEARFLAPWRDRLLRLLDARALDGQPQRAEFRRLVEQGWTGRADVDSVGYTLVREDFYAIYRELFGAVNEQLHGLSPRATFNVTTPRWSVSVSRLMDEAPAHWLPDGRSWRDVQLAAVDDAIARLTSHGEQLASARWGEHNRVGIGHRFARAYPWLARFLGAPTLPQAGDDYMPHVAMSNFGQSMRLVVTPGREAEGQLAMPGGESGHPLSAYFLADEGDWLAARPTSLLPGPARDVLTLSPQ